MFLDPPRRCRPSGLRFQISNLKFPNPMSFLSRVLGLFGVLVAVAAVRADPVRYESIVFGSASVQRDVVFRTATNAKGETETLKLDVYQPVGDVERKRPAILWLHGGGFRPGNDKQQKYIVAMATEFAKRGYVCISSDYRVRAEQGTGAGRLPVLQDAVEDSRAALAWTRAHAAELGIDPNRLAVGGGSAGGMAAVSVVALESADAAKRGTTKLLALVDLWGSPSDDFLIGQVDANFPPTVIVHGTADQSVPFAQSEKLAARLKAAGVKHELLALPGAPHTPTMHMEAIVKTTTAFVFAALKK